MSLGEAVAAELRAHLARHAISNADLIGRLGVSPDWFYRRMRGEVSFTLSEVERVAAALSIPVSVLLPTESEHVA